MYPGIWTALFHTHPLHEALARLHEIGFQAFEIGTEHLDAIEHAPDPDVLVGKALDVIRTLKLKVPQSHAMLGADVAQPDAAGREADILRLMAHFRLSARLGVKVVVMHPGGKGVATTAAERKRVRALNVEGIRRLADEAARLGLKIGLENLMRRGAAAPFEMLDLLEAVGHPAVGITLDTSHANVVGYSVPDYIREIGPHLIATHLSDNTGKEDQHRVPGAGTVDWAGVKSALREVRYEGILNLEIGGERHPDSDLQRLKLRHALAVAEWLAGG